MNKIDRYFYDSISESIRSLSDISEIVRTYGNPKGCDIYNYFNSQIQDGKLYNNTDEHSEHTYICEVSEFETNFITIAYIAFREWLDQKLSEVNEDKLIDISDSDSINKLNGSTEFMNRKSDFEEDEFNVLGNDTFTNLCKWSDNVLKCAILAGAKYVYYDTNNGATHFWK